MEIYNLVHDDTDDGPDGTEPPGYLGRSSCLGPKLGGTRIGMSVYDLPPGESVCPYHLDWTDEEWLIVVSGTPTVRSPDGEQTLQPGDVACFPAGPAGAHQVRNRSDGTVRVTMFSTRNEFGIAEYPDSDKIGIWAGDTHRMLRRSPQLDYWDAEH